MLFSFSVMFFWGVNCFLFFSRRRFLAMCPCFRPWCFAFSIFTRIIFWARALVLVIFWGFFVLPSCFIFVNGVFWAVKTCKVFVSRCCWLACVLASGHWVLCFEFLHGLNVERTFAFLFLVFVFVLPSWFLFCSLCFWGVRSFLRCCLLACVCSSGHGVLFFSIFTRTRFWARVRVLVVLFLLFFVLPWRKFVWLYFGKCSADVFDLSVWRKC